MIRKLVQAKQGADLHTATFNQIVAYEVARGGFMDRHIWLITAGVWRTTEYHAGRDGRVIPSWSAVDQTSRWIIPVGDVAERDGYARRYSK